jgi:hypothetical protein
MKFQYCLAIVAPLLIVPSIGCTARQGKWSGPASPAKVSVSRWSARPDPATVLSTKWYTIYTTLPPGERRDAVAQILEGAYAQYQALAPAKAIDTRPMHAFVFAERGEWEDFTSRKTGDDAAMYLKIPRGGYTIDDWFVAWSDNDRAIFSAAAHEGWHQYVARHFKGRLPPFLEEGVACLFENVRMQDGLPRWNTSVNTDRTRALARAVREGQLWPLEELVTMHAGDVVKLPREKIDAFYAQNWAFARFLLEAEGGRYRPLFEAWLADTAAGKSGRTWDPEQAKALLEHYLREQFRTTELAYRVFVMEITSDR